MPVLLTPVELAAELRLPPDGGAGCAPPVVLDVRWRLTGPPGRPDHAAGHVPGAVFVDLDTELAAPHDDDVGPAGRHPLPDPQALQAVLRRAGVRADSRVVAYDDGDGSVAARAWWLLRWAGLPAPQVHVLDGGWAAWVAEGLPVETGPGPRPAPGDITVVAGGMPTIDADGAAALAARGVLLDARAPERYRGEHEPVDPRAGHVPGARNAPFAGNIGPDGRWRSPAELARRFAEVGVADGVEVGAYCGSGITASSLVLALEHAGLTSPDSPATLYAGSWSGWCAEPGRPVAVGPEPAGAEPGGPEIGPEHGGPDPGWADAASDRLEGSGPPNRSSGPSDRLRSRS